LKISSTSGSRVRLYAFKAFLTIRTPPNGLIERLRGASVCKPTISSFSLMM